MCDSERARRARFPMPWAAAVSFLLFSPNRVRCVLTGLRGRGCLLPLMERTTEEMRGREVHSQLQGEVVPVIPYTSSG